MIDKKPAWRRWAVGVVCTALLLVCAFALDARVVQFLAQPISSGQTKATLMSLRAWGEGSTVAIILLAIVSVRPKDARRCAAIAVATLLVALSVSALKPLSGRLRPEQVAELGLTGPWHSSRGSNSSFPSGHVATAFAFARGLSASYPPLRPVCLFAACGTGASRMYERRHYLSDCLAGALLGWYLGGAVFAWLERLPRADWFRRSSYSGDARAPAVR